MTQQMASFSFLQKYVRPVVLVSCFISVFIALFYQAWNLQIRQHADYQKKATNPYKSNREDKLPADRGAIYARSGLSENAAPVLLADSETLYTLYLYPPAIQKKNSPFTKEASQALARILQVQEESLWEAAALSESSHRFARGLSEQQKEAISIQLKKNIIHGCIKLIPTPQRRYPRGDLAGSLLGIVNGEQQAQAGVEFKFDSYLVGKTEILHEIRLPIKDKPSIILPESQLILPQPGNHVYLTIHDRMQATLEKTLETGIDKLKEKMGLRSGIEGSAVAIDPKTGAVLAMTAVPKSNPVTRQSQRNRAVTDPEENGSVQKPFTVAVAIEDGLIKPNDEWDCENGKWKIPGMPANEPPIVDAEPHSVLTTTQCLARSSNICMAKIARKVGKDKLYSFLQKMGFGETVSTDFSGERKGSIPPLQKWDDKTFATISFGQGMTSTPLQIVAAIAAFANDGIYNKPYLVEKIASPSGEIVYEAEPERRQVFSKNTAAIVAKMMRAVMGKKGTAQGLDLPEYPIACKTGTAQRVNSKVKKRGYDRRLWTSSLVCFGPYSPQSKLVEPRLAIGVFLTLDFSSLDSQGIDGDDKLPRHTGAETAGSITQQAMKELLTIMKVPQIPHTISMNGRAE